MTDSNFIQKFDEKIQQLNTLRERIDSTIIMRQEFTQDLKDRLNDISKSITTLYGLISDLKQKRDILETNLNANNTNIQKNNDEINRCEETINRLTRDKQNMEQRLKEQAQVIEEKINEKQNIVEANEAKLRDLTQANERQKALLSELSEKINNKGTEKDRQHAEALERLNEQNAKQLAEKEALLSEKNSELGTLKQELSSTKEQLTNSQNSLQQQINENQAQITQLTDENTQLRSENQELREKIQLASETIETAIRDLTILMDREPNADTRDQIIDILNSITRQIEGSITMINNNNNTQGQAPGQESQNAVIIRDYPERLRDEQLTRNNIDNVLTNLQQHIDLPRDKSVQGQARDSVNKITDIKKLGITDEQVKYWYNKVFEEGFQKGGKKTRKNRKNRKRKTKKMKKNEKKQKGGFIYNPNTKRKKLKSSKNATRSRSSTRKRTYSSKTSRQSSKSSKSSF